MRTPATALQALALASLGLLACGGDSGGEGGDSSSADAGSDIPIGSGPGFLCGNAELDGAEECDDGSANSDTAPDACRADCLLPRCGDGILDAGEGCDDGNTASADGCSSMCAMESGSFEVEPNDLISDATPLSVGMPIQGFVDDGDVDCYIVDLGEEGRWMRASLGIDVPCEGAMTLSVYDADGGRLATGATGDDGLCPTLDPDEMDRLRVLSASSYYVCAEALLRRGERTYTLTVETGDGCGQGWEVPGSSDVDGDGRYDVCDDDDDGDGYLDEVDNCPSVANGGDAPRLALTDSGYIRHWIGTAFDETNAGQCLPVAESRFDPATLRPAAGEAVGEGAWRYVNDTQNSQRLDNIFGGGNERASWMYAYVVAPSPAAAELRFGSDDGVLVWVNGVESYSVAECRGASNDQDTVPVNLVAGVNVVAFKVYNGGGGWNLRARLVYADGNAVPNLSLLRYPNPDTVDDQRDTDGDGIGDACDG